MQPSLPTLIESVGVYLPPRSVSTQEVLRECVHPIRFPLEQMTGIVSRRMAGETEFAVDLAAKAIEHCLANSRRTRADIDLLICSHIARYDAPARVTYEPACSMILKKRFGFDNALVFDITNACAGMFSAIYLIDGMLKAGMIRCGMVASGEYITHLTRTAQREVRNYLDPRMACLTLGDAGAAVILERSSSEQVGFHAIDLYTLGKYSALCVAKPTDQEHGGAIMVTDSIRATAAVVEHTAENAAHVLRHSPYPLARFRHIIPHQTSRMSIKEGLAEIARMFDKNLDGAVIDNVAHRGNTASTSHFVALMDQILQRRINSGDSVMFCFSGSGITIGTALYTLDDLPERLRAGENRGTGSEPKCEIKREDVSVEVPVLSGSPASAPTAAAKWFAHGAPSAARVRVAAVGRAGNGDGAAGLDSRELLRRAAEACLAQSSYDRSRIDLLMSVGVYRTDFIAEPAAAAIAEGDLRMNEYVKAQAAHRTVALDLINGPLGFLNACCVAEAMIRAGRCTAVMVAAAEVDSSAHLAPEHSRGLCETGSAIILEPSPDRRTGFGPFLFRYFTEHLDCFAVHAEQANGATRLAVRQSPQFEDYCLQCIVETVRELLAAEGLTPSRLKVVLPPHFPSIHPARLAEALDVEQTKIVDVTCGGKDLFTSSTPYAFLRVREQAAAGPGDVGLIINAGAGIQVGCTLYYF